jgi:hypothetical protein
MRPVRLDLSAFAVTELGYLATPSNPDLDA